MTTELAVPDLNTEPKVVELSSRAQVVLAEVQALAIAGPATAAQADAFLVQISQGLKQAEEVRTFLVRPLNEHVARINQGFARLVAPFKQADGIIRQKLLEWKQRLREEQEAARREVAEQAARARAAVKTADPVQISQAAERVTAAVEQAQTVAEDPASGATTRREWDFEVVELRDVPRQYLLILVDGRAVRAALAQYAPPASGASAPSIPGLRIFEKETLVRRPGQR